MIGGDEQSASSILYRLGELADPSIDDLNGLNCGR